MNKFLRDTGILLAFCGAFYVLTVLVSRLEGNSETEASDFSPARKRVNVLVHKKNWSAAKFEFQRLTEQDPLNGYAWDGYATCLWEIRRDAIGNLNKSVGTKTPGAGQNDERERQLADLNDQIRETLLKVKRFSRYRYSALLRLAALECDRGNYDEAMDFLEEFVGRGYQTQRGLNWIENFGSSASQEVPKYPTPILPRFGAISLDGYNPQPLISTGNETRLHAEPRFWDLVERERDNPAPN